MKLCLSLLCSLSSVFAADASTARIQEAASKAVAIIQKSQKNWFSKASCYSCHQQVLPAIAFRYAREHGIFVDEAAAHADAVAAFGYLSNLPRAVEYTHVIDPALGDGYGMIGAEAAGVRPNLVSAVYARLLAARQESDGRWETVDVRPPQAYGPFVSTAVAMRAVQLYAHPKLKADTAARVALARTWLLSHMPHTTEERVYQLLGVHWANAEASSLNKMTAALKATQQPDGGWNSLDGLASDAYSTGQVLMALHEAGGVAFTDTTWQRGIDYLLRTQQADGSWHVISRLHPPAPVSPPYFETGHPYGHDQFISMMGNSVAVMALTTALGPGLHGVSHHEDTALGEGKALQEAEPKGIEPWVESLLFGDASDVKKLLDGGFNANSTSKAGGVTALMLATPDTAKMKLLLEHGANADARASNRYSALLVAAQYPHASAAMNLLLDHGAKVRLAKGEGQPLFNAYPLFLAALSGNSEMIGRLLKEGDRFDAKMNVQGLFPVTPAMELATTSQTNSVRALLDAGASANEMDQDGISMLSWAAIANRTEMARLLIARGADVNHVDKLGMTPLLYAASIDFGESAMTDLLLKSGASTSARNNDGLTASELARKYHHSHLLGSLAEHRASR